MSEHAPAAYRAEQLAGFAAASFENPGLVRHKARTVGTVLLEGDVLGHTTHPIAPPEPGA